MFQRTPAILKKLFIITPVTLINAFAFVIFYHTNGIAIGGTTGIAQIINRMIPVAPIGVTIMVLNIPIFLLGWKYLGGELLVSSLYLLVVNSVAVDLIRTYLTFPPMDSMLACIYGGLIMGLTAGLIMKQGATGGGTDLIVRLLKLKFPWLAIGKLSLILSLCIITATTIAFQNLFAMLYGLIALYVSSLAMDGIIYNMDKSQVAYIISDKYSLIACQVTQQLNRGVTLLQGHGAWSGEEKQVIMVAFKQRQIITVKDMVKEIDPNAFMIVCPAHEVLGNGFHLYKKNDL